MAAELGLKQGWRMASYARGARAASHIVTLVGALAVVGCSPSSSGASAADGGGGDDGGTTCQTGGYPVDTFALGMKKAGTESDSSANRLTFELVSANPAPPLDGMGDAGWNTWTIRVLDASGQPVKGAVVSLPQTASPYRNPWMPVHKHKDSLDSTVTNNGDGTATLKMHFFMPGLWNIFVQAQSGSTTDGVLFAFCL